MIAPDQDSDYWENRLPAQMLQLAADLPGGQRFDAIVIDGAQDFADTWWPAVLAALTDDQAGGLYVFSDEGQRIFARHGQPPVPLVAIMLDHNLRNTRQIAETFNTLAPIRMTLLGGDGPPVRYVDCTAQDAMEAGDDAVDALIDEGWRPQDVALLTTGTRHTEQAQRQAIGQDYYWQSFWDTDQVFYQRSDPRRAPATRPSPCTPPCMTCSTRTPTPPPSPSSKSDDRTVAGGRRGHLPARRRHHRACDA